MAPSTRRDMQRWTGRVRKAYARPAMWLATVSTVTGVVTGAVSIGQAGSDTPVVASASLVEFQRSVGGMCEQINLADRANGRRSERLEARLRSATSTLAQRNALLDATRRGLARSAQELAVLRSLEPPAPSAPVHREAVAAWNRNVERVMGYVARLDHAGTRAALVAAVRTLSDTRTTTARDGMTVRAALMRLGGRECRFEPPIVPDAITLPPPRRPKPQVPPPLTPIVTPSVAAETREAGPTAEVTPHVAPPVRVNPPDVAPPVRVNPPDGPISTGGGED